MRDTARHSLMRSVAPLSLVLTMASLTACGDDTIKARQATAEFRNYCDKTLAIETYPEPDLDYDSLSPEQLRAENRTFAARMLPLAEQVRSASPTEIKSDIDVLVGAVVQVSQTGDFEAAFDTPTADQASDRAHAFDLEHCGWAKVDVSGKDYAFSGIPKKLPAGPVSFEFTNAGKEPHEFVLFRVNDGVKESVKEIVALPQEQAVSLITQMGGTFAAPGEADYAVVNLEKGRYGVACYVPVGGGDDGHPHAAQGMHAAFEVT